MRRTTAADVPRNGAIYAAEKIAKSESVFKHFLSILSTNNSTNGIILDRSMQNRPRIIPKGLSRLHGRLHLHSPERGKVMRERFSRIANIRRLQDIYRTS